MKGRLMGVETEYAITAATRAGKCVDRPALVDKFFRAARQQLPNIRDFGGGMFLQNGSRLYCDMGLHPELATPECTSPSETVMYVLAGEEILRGIADSLEKRLPDIDEVQLFRTNVDYSGTQSTWGCHESYLHRTDPEAVKGQIIPHLASRVIYTGAGGFNPLAEGVEFSLSPRVAHLKTDVSRESTHSRGIFHTKNETLAEGDCNRLHILCGESLCSQTSSFLKIGTTALVVAMIEAGVCRAEAVQLRFPLQAMRMFSSDPRCQAAAALNRGKNASAIEIQRHYLSLAEANLSREFMPEWAEGVCREWRRVLDCLEREPTALDTTLDWAIKLSVFTNRVSQRGLVWESLPHWNRVLSWLRGALSSTQFHRTPITAELVLGGGSPLKNEVEALTPYLADVGLRWDDLDLFTGLKRELFEIDMRFAQLSRKSVFAALDKAGVLSHRLCGRSEVKVAVSDPPSDGRGRLRGEFVRRNGARKNRYYCDWRGVWDFHGKRALDLSNPFESEERWRTLSKEEEEFCGYEPWNLPAFLRTAGSRGTGSRRASDAGAGLSNEPPF